MRAIAGLELAGYAISGSRGESAEEMLFGDRGALEPHMPKGINPAISWVGKPRQYIEAVWRGWTFFDCVLPARNAKSRASLIPGTAGYLKSEIFRPTRCLDPECGCPVLREYSAAISRHLLRAARAGASACGVMPNLGFYNNIWPRSARARRRPV